MRAFSHSKSLQGVRNAPCKSCKLLQLGKMLVFKSGKVKLQMGGVLMDVSLGSQCQCLQHVVAVNVDARSAMLVGEIGHRATVTPDIDQLLGWGCAFQLQKLSLRHCRRCGICMPATPCTCLQSKPV